MLYYIIPGTGEIRYLGKTSGLTGPTLDPVDNRIYTTAANSDVIRHTYVGYYNELPADGGGAQFVTETFLKDLSGMVKAFDPDFDPLAFPGVINAGGQTPAGRAVWRCSVCKRGYQVQLRLDRHYGYGQPLARWKLRERPQQVPAHHRSQQSL